MLTKRMSFSIHYHCTKIRELRHFHLYKSTMTLMKLIYRFQIRNQIRILLRLGLQGMNIWPGSYLRTKTVIDSLAKLVTIYIRMIKLNVDVFKNDSALMRAWYRFTIFFPTQVMDVALT